MSKRKASSSPERQAKKALLASPSASARRPFPLYDDMLGVVFSFLDFASSSRAACVTPDWRKHHPFALARVDSTEALTTLAASERARMIGFVDARGASLGSCLAAFPHLKRVAYKGACWRAAWTVPASVEQLEVTFEAGASYADTVSLAFMIGNWHVRPAPRVHLTLNSSALSSSLERVHSLHTLVVHMTTWQNEARVTLLRTMKQLEHLHIAGYLQDYEWMQLLAPGHQLKDAVVAKLREVRGSGSVQ